METNAANFFRRRKVMDRNTHMIKVRHWFMMGSSNVEFVSRWLA